MPREVVEGVLDASIVSVEVPVLLPPSMRLPAPSMERSPAGVVLLIPTVLEKVLAPVTAKVLDKVVAPLTPTVLEKVAAPLTAEVPLVVSAPLTDTSLPIVVAKTEAPNPKTNPITNEIPAIIDA